MKSHSLSLLVMVAVLMLLPQYSSGLPTSDALQDQAENTVPKPEKGKDAKLIEPEQLTNFEDESQKLRLEQEMITASSDDNILGRQRRSFLDRLFGYPSGYYKRRWWPANREHGHGYGHGHGHGYRHSHREYHRQLGSPGFW